MHFKQLLVIIECRSYEPVFSYLSLVILFWRLVMNHMNKYERSHLVIHITDFTVSRQPFYHSNNYNVVLGILINY